MSQPNSRLLQLPRELRDAIYRYAVLEDTGYIYKAESGRLCTRRNTPVNLSLIYTCKKVYQETHGIALTTNLIIFLPQPDPSSAVHDASNSDRLQYLQYRYYEALRIMLAWMAAYVTSEHLKKLLSLYPENDDVLELKNMNDDQRLKRLMVGDVAASAVPSVYRWVGSRRSIVTLQILRDLVKLLSEHEAFDATTAKEYDADFRNGQVPPHLCAWYEGREEWDEKYDDRKYTPHYAPGSQKEILEKFLAPWWIIEESDLLRWERLLPPKVWVFDTDSDSESEPDSNTELEVTPREKTYFSATACAIHFLEGLSKETRQTIRNISIIEDHVARPHQASHSHGLIPYCKENPRLQVKVQVDIWNVLLWGSWHESHKDITHHGFLVDVTDYLRETLLLPAMGMPPRQYTLEFRGRTPEMTRLIWEGIKKLAEIQHAAIELQKRHPDQEKPWILRQSPPPDLYTLMKRVLEGGTGVQFDTCIGQPWDLEQVVRDLESSPENATNWEAFPSLKEYERQAEEFEILGREYLHIDE